MILKISEIWSGLFIQDPGDDCLPIPDSESGGQKGTGSRIRIRNTAKINCEFAQILLKIPFFQAPEQKRRARKVRLQDTTQLSAASSPRKTSNKEKDLQIRNGLGEKSNSFALWKFIGCELIERDTNSVSMCVFAAMMAPVYCLRPRFSGENRATIQWWKSSRMLILRRYTVYGHDSVAKIDQNVKYGAGILFTATIQWPKTIRTLNMAPICCLRPRFSGENRAEC